MKVASEWRAGWRVVLAAAIGYGTGGGMILVTAGMFITPMRSEFGWSTTGVTLAPIFSLVWAFSAPVVGAAVDRFGSRSIAIVGMLALALCMVALAATGSHPLALYTVAVVTGFCCAATNVAAFAKGVASWFPANMGTALGVTLTGSSLLALAAVPLTSIAIQSFGWRAGYVTLAAIILVIGLPFVLAWFRERPAIEPSGASTPVPTGATFRNAVGDMRFWIFVFALGIGAIPIGGFLGHLQPLFTERGFGVFQASGLVALYAVASTIGRIAGGILLDRFWDYGVAAMLFALAGTGGFIVAHVELDTANVILIAAVCLIGMGHGAEADFVAYFTARTFGTRAYSAILGTMAMASSLGMSAGAFCFAALFDRFGNYLFPCYIGASCFLLAGLTMLSAGLMDRLQRRRTGSITDRSGLLVR